VQAVVRSISVAWQFWRAPVEIFLVHEQLLLIYSEHFPDEVFFVDGLLSNLKTGNV